MSLHDLGNVLDQSIFGLLSRDFDTRLHLLTRTWHVLCYHHQTT
jgi:hypothetical protein